jgi:fatty acid desaturase
MSSASSDAPEFPDPIPSDHTPVHWVNRAAFPIIVLGLVLSQAGIIFSVQQGWYWLAVLLVLLASHFMHGTLVGFHEASHSNLRKSRFLNDLDGVLIGTLSFMSFTLYRVAHQTHHMYLATERDEELWPFVKTDSPRWFRRWIAFVELNVGLIFTPYLFARMFLKKDSFIKNKRVRRRIWMEFALIALVNLLILAFVAWMDAWTLFLWSYVAPAIIAGNLQSWRKYIEHVGLSGHTARSATRSIIADTWTGRLISVTLLHEPFHGVHHLRSGLRHTELPVNAPLLQPVDHGDVPPFPNYRSAILDLLRNLRDPRSGSHWPDGAVKAST